MSSIAFRQAGSLLIKIYVETVGAVGYHRATPDITSEKLLLEKKKTYRYQMCAFL